MQKHYLNIFIGVAVILLVIVFSNARQYRMMGDGFFMDRDDGGHMMDMDNDDDTEATTSNTQNRMPAPGNDMPTGMGKLKADTFTGILETVDTGCFADGECFVEVGGRHVTALMGWSRDTVGSVQGVDSFGDLEQYIGKTVEVYAQVNPDNTYTLYGSEGFYIKPITVAAGGCVIGGCSGQVCGDAATQDGMVTTCEFREEYACYQNAKCERQTNGQCGWTESEALTQCLNTNRGLQLPEAQ